ncbi:alginate lyase family protein [Neiella sp. HB171785]|uniref:Alginate lyase family protein n=1 Tax=Neiella litorisoli TaxID=2771431 RepID=A0A8J6UQE2_9GAMM|nr:alginate lyase family protein [Neiella litorisoli]MBD1391067.1 alginate lyase family protein [Neiella litorisoli]
MSTTVNAADHVTHPNLVITADDVAAMRQAIEQPGLFQQTYQQVKASLDEQMQQPITVPVPKDAGGGYTHERHKKNQYLMYNAGVIYQLTQQQQYADYVRDMLLQYAELYPTLPIHPQKKSSNAGKLFWQGLNEAVWLVYTIQAYDAALPGISQIDRNTIEQGVLRPVALFLSEQSPHTFNKVHNHGTWATAAVGMTGYVLNEPEWVEKALYDLDKSGKGGFLRQMQDLFSPQGYYSEGPYYQRYALMPFVTFAKAIETNEPERKIFEYRNGLLLKAIDTTIQLSYNKLFFPLNDAIKSKGIDTIELINGVAIKYGLTGDPQLLSIAKLQDQILLTGDGLKVAQGIEQGLAQPYDFQTKVYGDSASGDKGALVILRQQAAGADQAVVFKATGQGMGHGHFDKLNWQFYDAGSEIVSDYGAARFLNVEAKFGGRYLPENDSYAKQTVAHNTLVVDETSHYDGNWRESEKHYPELLFFADDDQVAVTSAKVDSAYQDVSFKRTMALLKLADERSLVIDIVDAEAKNKHQFDLPVNYQGQLIETSFQLAGHSNLLKPVGSANGYQHLWLKATAEPQAGLNKVTWLNEQNNRFYSYSTLTTADTQLLFTQTGANDPDFNLRNQHSFILRVPAAKQHTFVSVLEPHGEYNPAKEYTLNGSSQLTAMTFDRQGDIDLVTLTFVDDARYLLAIANGKQVTASRQSSFSHDGKSYVLEGRFSLLQLD